MKTKYILKTLLDVDFFSFGILFFCQTECRLQGAIIKFEEEGGRKKRSKRRDETKEETRCNFRSVIVLPPSLLSPPINKD